ncbi:MAG: PQQ-dependent sugar dehydrogenase, partial [Flavobacteriales bacterium]|nr:PQQ-dependent sugar dehydrogenase [Flavobacteriales bacterium]
MVFLPDGRMLVSLLSGSMLITEPWDQPPVDWGVYLEMTNVDGSGEHGVIELMLDPDFVSNGHFYVYYSANTAQGARNRLSRFTHLGDSSSMSTEVVLWEDPEPYVNCCHTGGAMTFMDDGTILLAVGDDFRPATAQDMSSGFGKVHRIHADGSVPMDNPFWDATPGPFNANGVLKTIYCSGLRNPFRGSLDPVTGLFLIGEVGGNNHGVAWEDLHAALPGANFGWPSCGDNGRDPDGGCSDPQFVDPVFAYSHAGTGASITGGITYTGSQFPS